MVILQRLRERLDSWGIILASGAIYGVSQAIIGHILHALDPAKALRVQTTLSADVVREILAGWKGSGLIDRYLFHYYFDFPHALWYGIFLGAMIAKLMNRRGLSHRYDALLLMPFMAGICDLFENISHLVFIHISGTITPIWVGLSGTAALLKWSLAALSLVLITVLAVQSLLARRRYA